MELDKRNRKLERKIERRTETIRVANKRKTQLMKKNLP